MELAVAFGEVLRDYRQRAGLSQEALALACDLDRTFISLLERGLRQPTLGSLFALAGPLSAPPSELVEAIERKLRPRRSKIR